MNPAWHEAHRMPKNATTEQRLAWHREHQQTCACRPVPASLRGLLASLPAADAEPARPKKAARATQRAAVQRPTKKRPAKKRPAKRTAKTKKKATKTPR